MSWWHRSRFVPGFQVQFAAAASLGLRAARLVCWQARNNFSMPKGELSAVRGTGLCPGVVVGLVAPDQAAVHVPHKPHAEAVQVLRSQFAKEQEGPWPRPGGGVKTKRRAPRGVSSHAHLRCLAQRAWRPPQRERGRGAAGGGKAQGLAHENLHVRPWELALPEEAREFGRRQERRGNFAVVLTVPGGG